MTLVERIQTIMVTNKLTPAAFADRIGVQRSSVSHVLNGRNKPSLDFIEKILLEFPKVSATWLITGKEERTSVKPSPVPPIPVHKAQESAVRQIIIFYTDGRFEIYKNE